MYGKWSWSSSVIALLSDFALKCCKSVIILGPDFYHGSSCHAVSDGGVTQSFLVFESLWATESALFSDSKIVHFKRYLGHERFNPSYSVSIFSTGLRKILKFSVSTNAYWNNKHKEYISHGPSMF